MSNYLGLMADAVGQPHDTVLVGAVSAHQPAPTSFASPLYVVVDGWDPDYYQTVARWPACHGSALPAPGAFAVLERLPIQPGQGAGELICTYWQGATPTATGAHGETAGYSAGLGTAVTVDGATTGGLGTTAYTLGDMVRTFKELGILPH